MAGAVNALLCSFNVSAVSTKSSNNDARFMGSSSMDVSNHSARQLAAVRLRANAKGFTGPTPSQTTKLSSGGRGGGEEDEEEKIPQVVFERILVRMAGFVGVPLAAGIGLLYVVGTVKERQLWDVPMWVPFVTTLLCFGSSAMGIAYGTLSTSWDADRTGSVIGFEEARRNWADMWREDDDHKAADN